LLHKRRKDWQRSMFTQKELDHYLAGAHVDASVFALRPDYRVLLLAVSGIVPGASDDASEALLTAAETYGQALLEAGPVDQLPHIGAWREAYKQFGAKPQRTRNSLEALVRRTPNGLPRINRLTDHYNAISVLRQIPLGGEDLDRYVGPPRLVRAVGTESFDTTADGNDVVEHPLPGEVIWCDDAGVTCRLWNWRQARRTQLTDETTSALFILDALNPLTDDELEQAGDELLGVLVTASPDLVSARRTIRSS
jgi:DNA/RNA-binding domain of Phe-tRNA-synthetase-like protein